MTAWIRQQGQVQPQAEKIATMLASANPAALPANAQQWQLERMRAQQAGGNQPPPGAAEWQVAQMRDQQRIAAMQQPPKATTGTNFLSQFKDADGRINMGAAMGTAMGGLFNRKNGRTAMPAAPQVNA